MAGDMDALAHGCYLITTALDGKRYGMTCSWAVQVDYDRVMLVIGGQSATGRAIRKSRVFGVSVLASDQRELALRFGAGHSSRRDKFDGVETLDGSLGVPLMAGSLRTFECRLVDDEAHPGSLVGIISHFRIRRKAARPLLLCDVDH